MEDIGFWQLVFERDKGWPERVKKLLVDFGVELLSGDFEPLFGGLRKVCFRVKAKQGDLVLAFWPPGSLSRAKIIASLKFEDWVGRKGVLPTRKWVKLGNRGIVKVKVGGYQFWLGVLTYLPGKPIWTFQPEQIFQIGKALGKFHKGSKGDKGKMLLHLDFGRGNLLFDKKKKLCGVLDFEEAKWGEVEEDLGCTLSFLVADNLQLEQNRIEKVFLSGYQRNGLVFNYDKMVKHFNKFLKERMKENSKQFLLAQAKKRLTAYQQQIKAKILGTKGLAFYAQRYRGKEIVFVVGAFELLHWGHLEFLEKARSLGDLLVVGVASDESRRRLKGKPYPLITDRTRRETLAHFPFIDAVIIIDEDDVTQEIKDLRPKTFYTAGKDWQEGLRKPEEERLVKRFGGKIIKAPYFLPNLSSSQMVEKVAMMKIRQSIFQRIKRQPLLRFKKGRKILKEIKFSDLGKFGQKLHRQGKTIIFASGTADLFHLGHARFYQKAKSIADVLVVGLPSNESVRALKGPGRPFIDEKARALVMAHLDWVDYVVIFDERTILTCLKKLKPDIFFTVKEDWNTGFLDSPEAQFMKSIGGKIVRSEKQSPYLSGSKMIDKAAGEMIQKKFSDLIKIARETPVFDADNGFDPHSPQAQLAARERGFYEQVLVAVAERGKCVFCDLKEKYLIAEKDGVVLTVALFPYIDGHLLIIPRRHIESLSQLNEREERALLSLGRKGIKLLKERLAVENVWFLLREGKGIKAGKTVKHLHFHLIPYSPEVIKMGETELKIEPIKIAKKLREK